MTRLAGVAAVVVGCVVLVACSSDAPTGETGAEPATGVAVTGATSEGLVSVGPREGTCADTLEADSVQSLACRWVAEADIAVCPWLTESLLGESFGGSRGGCELAIGRLKAAADKATVGFSDVSYGDDAASLAVDDGPRAARYQLTFVRESDSWYLDTITTTQKTAPATSSPVRERDPEAEAEAEVKNLALRWYRDVDPGVCDSMTDEVLDFGWAKKGDAGRALCHEKIANAEPLANVKTRPAFVNGERAKVKVLYTQGGERLIDEVQFVRRNGAWLIDKVRLSGFAS